MPRDRSIEKPIWTTKLLLLTLLWTIDGIHSAQQSELFVLTKCHIGQMIDSYLFRGGTWFRCFYRCMLDDCIGVAVEGRRPDGMVSYCYVIRDFIYSGCGVTGEPHFFVRHLSCPNDYVQIGLKCYKALPMTTDYSYAYSRTTCAADGAQLAGPSAKELQNVMQVFKAFANDPNSAFAYYRIRVDYLMENGVIVRPNLMALDLPTSLIRNAGSLPNCGEFCLARSYDMILDHENCDMSSHDSFLCEANGV